MSRILVTGANGFLGAHIVKEALDSGYIVRGTVRSSEKAEELKKIFPSAKFETAIVPDLIQSNYTEALKGVTAIIHSASPFVFEVNDHKKDLLDPAIEGTLSVLRAAQTAGIRRIVLTSSIGALLNKPELLFADVTYGPDDWFSMTYEQAASGQLPGVVVYLASKKLAEAAAWDFAKEHPELKLTTIIPTIIYGPVIHPISSLQSINTSNSVIYSLINGAKILPPDSVPTFCDVVSIARIHVKALHSDAAVGKRVPFSKGPATMYQILQIIMKARPELANRLPPVPEVDPIAGKTISRVNSMLAMDTLGVEGLELEETVLQTVDSLLELEKKLGTN
ncbi:NAD(P)-binding protein [Gymnopus androsaceus JB14]|uniref:NAD(P)-binding protein n=1 Tax=Gymnopus androsaceus JB14 TaxID=1447944 RepID=A0A6A4GS38_9AGAR|nr:NAD(P)-binding protein [Gymnopus androsaceus JB14]